MFKYLSASLALGLFFMAQSSAYAAEPFSHANLNRVLQTYVDSSGLVDYAALKADRQTLDTYVAALGNTSPDSHPARFPTQQDALAYWINAYNAFVLRGVIDHYPLKSVKDIALLNGFFNRVDFVAGGKELTLDTIENKIIRPRYRDPRIHFVVNCGAWSCPALENRAFDGATLDQRLDEAARRSLNNPKYAGYDAGRNTFLLSKILDWYGKDFVEWYPADTPASPQLLDYVRLYLSAENLAALEGKTPKVDFFDYDWRLNGQQ